MLHELLCIVSHGPISQKAKWMASGSETIFYWVSSSIANHGGYLNYTSIGLLVSK
jgi:hypothetical protein